MTTATHRCGKFSTPLTAAADDHTSGGMIALMPTAEDAARLAIPGGEPVEELHLTLFYLGPDGSVWTEDQRNELEGLVRARAALVPPVQAKIFGAAHWNADGGTPAWVWSVGDNPDAGLADSTLEEARYLAVDSLESTHERPEAPPQHNPWVAHICAAYSDDPAFLPELEQRLGVVTFDRIRLSFGDDDRDIPLAGQAVNLTAAGPLRRDPTPLELAARTDFASVHHQWEAATARALSALASVTAAWRLDLRHQITQKLAADDPASLPDLTLNTGDAADVLLRLMDEYAQTAGRACQREAEAQGVKVPAWHIPEDDTLTAAGGRRLLSSVAQFTSDLMAGSMLQAAKRMLSGFLRSGASPQAVAGDVDRALADDKPGMRGAVGSAMTAAQNAGRLAVFEAAPPAETYAASEVLDRRTCKPCKDIDGTEYPTLAAAINAYPVMGYKNCSGAAHGNSCRGFLVAVWQEVRDPSVTAGALQANEGETVAAIETLGKGEPNPGTKKDKRLKENQQASDLDIIIIDYDGDDDDEDEEDETTPGTGQAMAQGKPNKGTPKDKRLRENKQSAAGQPNCPPGMKPDPDGDGCVPAGQSAAVKCPPGWEPDPKGDGCVPSKSSRAAGESLAHGAAADADTVEGKPLSEMGSGPTAPWRGPLTVEGIETGDGREFKPDALTWADPPLPLRWNIEDSHGGEPRTKAVNVGRIDRIWRDEGGLVMGEGMLDLSDENGQRAHDKIRGGFLRGVSVDVDSIKDADMELVWPTDPDADGEGPDPFDMLFASPEKVVFNRGRIRAATLVDIPAFAEAYIALLDEDGAVVAGGEPVGAVREARAPRARVASVEAPVRPPAGWFADPGLSVPTGITVTPEGRVYGHAALWGTCHIGQAGVCVTPPREDSHPYFMTGNVWCEDQSSVQVGQITVGTGHAPLSYGYRAASDHYDNTGAAVADVAVGNDAHGIWVAGSIRPGTSESRIRELRAAGQVSGDWRRIGGSLRLVGLLAVNVPGFPVPKLKTHLTSGQQVALVAAGIPQLHDGLSEDELDQWAYRRVLKALSHRVHGEE